MQNLFNPKMEITMNTSKKFTPKEDPAPVARKEVKKLTIRITDPDALKAAYPQIMEERTVVIKTPNKKLLRPIVNALYAIGQQVPGVNAYYASEEEEKQNSENSED